MKIRYILLALLVLCQLLWLGCQYHARRVEMEQAPRLLVACDSYDPRDIFRGDYLSLSCSRSVFLGDARIGKSLWWGEPLMESVRNRCEGRQTWCGEMMETGTVESGRKDLPSPPPGFLPLEPRAPGCADAVELVTVRDIESSFIGSKGASPAQLRMAGFWTRGKDGLWEICRVESVGSSQDVTQPGEIRTTLHAGTTSHLCRTERESPAYGLELRLSLTKRWEGLRYYVPEKTGDLWILWRQSFPDEDFPAEKLRYTAEIIVRPSASLMLRRVFVNGIPYQEAVELVRQGRKEELLKGRPMKGQE